jgi:transposase-like protein
MDREWLASQLEAGRSLESIAREVGRAPSTVAYWANKYGLTSIHASRHAAKGGIEREMLAAFVDEGLSVRAIAAQLGLSVATVRHWLRRHGLATDRQGVPPGVRSVVRTCKAHGRTTFVRYGTGDSLRCERCRKDRVVARRRRVKQILIEEAGGACFLCGYERFAGALQFHHVNPATKSFGLARHGAARSLARSRAEAAKCVLLCANCHAEVEGGFAELPYGRVQPVDDPAAGRPGSDAG